MKIVKMNVEMTVEVPDNTDPKNLWLNIGDVHTLEFVDADKGEIDGCLMSHRTISVEEVKRKNVSVYVRLDFEVPYHVNDKELCVGLSNVVLMSTRGPEIADYVYKGHTTEVK